MKNCAIALTFLCLALLVGCVSVSSPAISEERQVQSDQDASKEITIPEGMVYGDYLHTRGIRFAPGVYKLEAQDDAYWYFAAPSAVEYRIFQGGNVTDDKFIPGGLALAKKSLNLVPGAAYMNGENDGKKILTWKLGAEFLSGEGRYWKKSF